MAGRLNYRSKHDFHFVKNHLTPMEWVMLGYGPHEQLREGRGRGRATDREAVGAKGQGPA